MTYSAHYTMAFRREMARREEGDSPMMRHVRNLIIPILTIIAMLSPFHTYANAQDLTNMSIEELMNVTVAGASRFEQKVSDAPAFVNIVTKDDIKKYGYRTLAEILRSLPGFSISYDRTYSYIGLRGFGLPGDYNTRFLILLDGHRLNDNIFDQTGVGTDSILDIDLIDKVEVIQGPGSSLYGSNAFFGVINIVTRKAEAVNGVEASGSAGSFDTYTGRLTYGKKFGNGFEMLLSASGSDSKGDSLYFKEFNDPATNFGVTRDTDYDRGRSAFAKLSYRDFTFTGAYSTRTKGTPTASFETDFNSRSNHITDERVYLDLGYNHTFDNEVTLKGHVSFDQYFYDGKYSYAPQFNIDKSRGTWWGGDLLVMKTLWEKHRVSVGGEYIANTQQDQSNYYTNPYSSVLDDKRDSTRWAVFLQDEFSILTNLVLNAGVRYDHYSTFGGTLNPRAALIYRPFEKSTFKLLYGSAFRAPNPYELYYNDWLVTKANPSLSPETIKTYEFVYEQFFLDHFRAAGAVFYNTISDLVLQQTGADGLSVFQNTGKVETKGFEAELEGTWKNGLRGRLSYTYQDAKDKDTDRSLVNSPKYMAKLNVIAPLWQDKVFSGLEMQYMGSRKTLNGTKTGGSLLTNLTLFSQNILKGLEVSFSVYNLFDKKYSYPASNEHYPINTIEQDGRTFRFKVTYGF